MQTIRFLNRYWKFLNSYSWLRSLANQKSVSHSNKNLVFVILQLGLYFTLTIINSSHMKVLKFSQVHFIRNIYASQKFTYTSITLARQHILWTSFGIFSRIEIWTISFLEIILIWKVKVCCPLARDYNPLIILSCWYHICKCLTMILWAIISLR